jgi:hypothetical protein
MAAPAIGVRPRWAPGPSAKINWSHPLSQGLIGCILPGQSYRDLVYGVQGTAAGTTNFAASPFGQSARATTGATDTNHLDWNGPTADVVGATAGTFTLVVTFENLGTAGNNNSLLASRWGVGNQWLIYTSQIGGPGTVRCGVGSTGLNLLTGPTIVAGETAVVTMVRDGINLALWKNGVLGASNASGDTGGFVSTSTSTLRMFNKTDDSGTSGTNVITALIVQKRALSANEIVSLHADPFQMLSY